MQLLTASLDDLVFEGRNKAYGAYQLRQQYSGNLASAGGLTLGIAALLLAGILAWPAAQPKPTATFSKPVEPTVVKLEDVKVPPPKEAKLAPAHVAPAAPKAARASAPTLPTQVAKDELVPPTKPVEAIVPATPDGAVGPPTTGPADPLATASSSGPTSSTGTEVASASSEPFTFVEKMPEFAGGQAALLRYLSSHLRYPTQALREGAEGRVFLSFVVGADGAISEVTVLKGLGFGLDEEATRVVRQMPAWTPGYQARHAVPVRFTLPITFKMQ